jgi:hypothetical protein
VGKLQQAAAEAWWTTAAGDHRGTFGDALRVLRHCFTCDGNEREQQ